MQELILEKLSGYHKPKKTKQLAYLLSVDRVELMKQLNDLAEKKIIIYVKTKTRCEEKICGWLLLADQNEHVRCYKKYINSLRSAHPA